MLRQLARLGRSVPFAGPKALAIAVYSDGGNRPIRAQQAGYEEVACVDDAARALELYCDIWKATAAPWALRWCHGLLDFILAMQDADGRWLNFILDWDELPITRRGRRSRGAASGRRAHCWPWREPPSSSTMPGSATP